MLTGVSIESTLAPLMAQIPHITVLGGGPAGLAVDEIRRHLHRFSNLRLIGRCGTFSYGWIHNMIREGRQAVESIGHTG